MPPPERALGGGTAGRTRTGKKNPGRQEIHRV
jgi:hypothetical protein